jgi:GNAT superfamily N-acetyltransferase
MRVTTELLTSPELAYQIVSACSEFDQPDIPVEPIAAFRATLELPWPGHLHERYLGLLDGAPVGFLSLGLSQHDNLANMHVELKVLPSARRHGVGRALHELAVERARAVGRKVLLGSTVERHPDGAAFATALGARLGLEDIRSRLDVRAVDQPLLDGMLAEAWRHAEGYRVVRWQGSPPDEIIDDVAYLEGRLNADAPTGDLPLEPEKIDAERLREGETWRSRRGRVSYHTAALHGDRAVAWTEIVGPVAEPAHAWQNTTIVDPAHRGRRLGTVVKLENLRYVRELRPGLEAIDTFNAASNQHMLRINRAMGFAAVVSVLNWQQTV